MLVPEGDHLAALHDLKHHLNHTFSIKDLGKLSYFLGIEVCYLNSDIALTQRKFTRELLHDAGIIDFKSFVTPLPINHKLQVGEGELCLDPTFYSCFVGKLNFPTHTRPDLAYTVQHLSSFLQQPRDSHYKGLLHTLRYVASTAGLLPRVLLKQNIELCLQLL